jgi:hypothetical protein
MIMWDGMQLFPSHGIHDDSDCRMVRKRTGSLPASGEFSSAGLGPHG